MVRWIRVPGWRLIFRLGLWACLVIISFLAFAPLASDPGTGHDKANHILAFLVLAGLADLAYPGPAPGRGWGKWVSLLAYGLLIETVQRFLPYREFSGWDLVADGIGIWLYVAGARLAMSVRTGRTRP
ncbi:MAG: VanZ family protein [Chromatiaceae bacterium]|nr:VanZ family protein [Chromatiaceae bacterium]